jgi:membrane protease YdiL (CAAX protease family)
MKMEKNTAGSRLVRFFLITYLISYSLYGISFILQQNGYDLLSSIIRYAGGTGPLISTLIMIIIYEDGNFRKSYLKRIHDLKRIPLKWYLVILLTTPLLMGSAALVDLVINGNSPEPELASTILSAPWLFFPLIVFYLLFGPFPEEVAWRGYALDKFQTINDPLTSSLILSLFWAGWHLPLFFLKGTYQHMIGFGTQGFILYMMSFIFQTIIMTWIYNRTNGSILSAILFHFMVNFIGEMYGLSIEGESYYLLLWAIMALVVAIKGRMWNMVHIPIRKNRSMVKIWR